jgi:hypothetical protein
MEAQADTHSAGRDLGLGCDATLAHLCLPFWGNAEIDRLISASLRPSLCRRPGARPLCPRTSFDGRGEAQIAEGTDGISINQRHGAMLVVLRLDLSV